MILLRGETTSANIDASLPSDRKSSAQLDSSQSMMNSKQSNESKFDIEPVIEQTHVEPQSKQKLLRTWVQNQLKASGSIMCFNSI